MADVFIAYAQENRETAAEIAAGLVARGYNVWWDTSLIAGTDFSDIIMQKINEAGAVLVLWTTASVKSQWVRAEARFAAEQKKLLPIMTGGIQPADLPLGFLEYHTERLDEINDSAFNRLIAAFAHFGLTSKADERSPTKQDERAQQTSKGQAAEQPWVFVSHADEDKARIRPFVEKLLESGLRVFVDKPAKLGLSKKWVSSPSLNYIRFFDNYRMAISRALDGAGCVIVFWSSESVKTERQIFWDEVEFGSTNGFLVSTMIDDVISGASKIPKGYGFSQANIADLTSKEALDNEFDWVIADIKVLISEYGRKLRLPPAATVN